MNYNSESSHVFYIILIILCALIILNIVERQLLVKMENKSEKNKINILYYETIFRNIKLGKVVLFILLFTVFLILINPFKLFSIFKAFFILITCFTITNIGGNIIIKIISIKACGRHVFP